MLTNKITKIAGFILLSLLWLAAANKADALLFVSTGQTGAQVQTDVNHTQSWTYSVSTDVYGIDGGLFVMKIGPKTSADILFTITDVTTSTLLMSVVLSPTSFTQSFSPVRFEGSPIYLSAGHTYTATLSSAAADTQVDAYFIKGGSDSPLLFVDENVMTVSPGGAVISMGSSSPTNPSPVPEPATLLLIGSGMGVLSFLGRKKMKKPGTL